MMYKMVLILIFTSVYYLLTAQSIEVHYKSLSSTNFDESAEFILQCNLTHSIFYNKKILEDTYQSEEQDIHGLPEVVEFRFERKENYILKSLRDNAITELVTDFNGNYLQINDTITSLNWKLIDDERTILGATCSKATTTFRGREYEVWYNKDIPVSNGPWKFDGLPGLIYLMQEKSIGLIGYEATRVKFKKDKTFIVLSFLNLTLVAS